MKVLTANRLIDGAAVWLAADHSWSLGIHDAEIACDPRTEEKLQRAGHAALLKNEVVDVNLIDIELAEGGVRPKRLRERIRVAGPTVGSSIGRTHRPGLQVAA